MRQSAISQPGQEFIRLSARIGKSHMLVQGGGGNTSIKRDDAMWVKASGTWLAEAERREIFVRVDLKRMRTELVRGIEPDFGTPSAPSPELRPSIEATLHVALPHRVVAHYHSVNAIAIAVRRDAPPLLRSLLSGLRWVWVPYRRPGMPLALAVQERLGSHPDVLVLANHGIIAGGDTPEETWSLICEVERRLEQSARASPEPDVAALEALTAGTAYIPAARREFHGIATDPVSLEVARRGSLYPDHVVFLGPGLRTLDDVDGADVLGEAQSAETPIVAVPGKGLLVHRSLTPGQREMAHCLALVLPRIPAGSPVSYLAPEQETELLGWQAEAYRKAMDT